ncbi:MAG: sensor histidine kinase [Sphingomicrobium sp.]
MMEEPTNTFSRLPTPAKILLIISLALLPIGVGSAWSAKRGFDIANAASMGRARDQAMVADEAMNALIARNTLAVRLAANAALAGGSANACEEARRILAIAPAVSREFTLSDTNGVPTCTVGRMTPSRNIPVAPGDFRLWIAPARDAIYVRAGVMGGTGTVRITAGELRDAISDRDIALAGVSLLANGQELVVIPAERRPGQLVATLPLAAGKVSARLLVDRLQVTTAEQLFIFLPLLMWVAAAMVSWWMVHRYLIQPLRRLQRAVVNFQPGEDSGLVIPPGLGPATEIHELGEAFSRAVDRIEGAEREALEALEGQRRLVREVHHRVKNNLQVVASLLSIHGRSAAKPEAKEAYSAIGRRVDALSVVHRNHYAELEESRGIALRPLLTELATGLRSSAPPDAQKIIIELDLDSPSTTQDVAVAASFLVTEIVEFAMLRHPTDKIEISLRRIDELTATLAISASVLVADSEQNDVAKEQFERIVEGLARQLRSPLERIVGRYAVTLPVFPDS